MVQAVQQGIDYRVSLRNSTNRREFVTLEATPDLIETRNVNYKTIDPVHAPGQMVAYQNTQSRGFNLSQIKLISRTRREASINLWRLWVLRAWCMPRFGLSTLSDLGRQFREQAVLSGDKTFSFESADGTTETAQFSSAADFQSRAQQEFGGGAFERRGEPPPVLLLSAYSRPGTVGKSRGHINQVPVVITNLSIPYPSDADYIPDERTGVPMPTIMTLDMQLTETHSPREYENFSLSAFKAGILGGF